MKIVCISDTHNQHEKLTLPEGDVLIHAGDWTGTGTHKQIISFIRWFANQPHKHKILIAGNHETTLDLSFYQTNWSQFHSKYPIRAHELKSYVLREEGIIYLENYEAVIEGVKFYGSPVSPEFNGWAFGVERGEEIRRVWDQIPEDTDVLITHCPPYGYGDKLENDVRVGCKDLLATIKRIEPKVHIYGHIHNGYGTYEFNSTKLINSASCDEHYQLVNPPIVCEV